MPISKIALSGSISGRGELINSSTAPGTTIHTGPSLGTETDEIWLYAANSDSVDYVLTILWGGSTSPDDYIVSNIWAYQGLTVVVPGLLLVGNTTPLTITAFCDTANKISVFGYANRIS